MTAPATSGRGKPKLVSIPIIAIPAVPADRNEVPVVIDVTVQMMNAVNRKILGEMTDNP